MAQYVNEIMTKIRVIHSFLYCLSKKLRIKAHIFQFVDTLRFSLDFSLNIDKV
jgi:hypothetical protein